MQEAEQSWSISEEKKWSHKWVHHKKAGRFLTEEIKGKN